MDDDLILIERFRAGDLGGFEMLVKKYQGKAVNIAYRLNPNVTNAQDIAQEAFIKVYEGLQYFRAESKFSSWFYRIVINCAYDFIRKNKRKLVQLEDCPSSELLYNQESGDCLAKELISWAIQKVPFKYRAALVLRELELLSYEDISVSLGISRGTVESRIFRGRQILKDILERKGVFKDELR